MANFNQNLVSTGLTTISTSVPEDGHYKMDGKISLPSIVNGGGPSEVVCVINQQGSPIYTGTAGADGFGIEVDASAGDVFDFVLSSSAAADQPLNVIKMSIAISEGE